MGLLIADYLKVPFVILSKISIDENVYRIVPQKVARKQKVIVFAKDSNGIKLAMVDPRNQDIPQLLAKKTGLPVIVIIRHRPDLPLIRKALEKMQADIILSQHLKIKGIFWITYS